MTQQKLLPFIVTKTPKIRDNRGNYVKRGETAYLTQATAEHYHKLGYVQVSMSGMFDDKPAAPEPDSSARVSNEGETSTDAASDVGEGEAEDGARPAAHGRRRRTIS